MCLELLLFGSFDDSECTDASRFFSSKVDLPDASPLAPVLISRRARGKAIDRLVIDYSHIHRQSTAGLDKNSKKASSDAFQKEVAMFCRQIIFNIPIVCNINYLCSTKFISRQTER